MKTLEWQRFLESQLTRRQLDSFTRLCRYRIPIKLIYCCGLRLRVSTTCPPESSAFRGRSARSAAIALSKWLFSPAKGS
jgi:hypothetical protein